MAVTREGNPKRLETVVINDDAEAPSLLNPMSGEIFVTNKVGRCIFELADGESSVDEIIRAVSQRFKGTTDEVIRADTLSFLEDSTKRGLITWPQS